MSNPPMSKRELEGDVVSCKIEWLTKPCLAVVHMMLEAPYNTSDVCRYRSSLLVGKDGSSWLQRPSSRGAALRAIAVEEVAALRGSIALCKPAGATR